MDYSKAVYYRNENMQIFRKAIHVKVSKRFLFPPVFLYLLCNKLCTFKPYKTKEGRINTCGVAFINRSSHCVWWRKNITRLF